MMRAPSLFLGVSLLALAACGNSFNQEAGVAGMADFGNATMNNTMLHNGQKSYAEILTARFASEVVDTVTFPFNSAVLDDAARTTLAEQANWIRQFPELRFRVYGHTDLVGSNAYNQALGLRRAQAVVAYFSSQGISRSRLEAMASYGKTRPVVHTTSAEERNRRTVTEVSGFADRNATPLNGKYARVIMREYLDLAKRPHPLNTVIETQTAPGGE